MISEAINALKAGEELKDASTWKSLQATTAAVSAVIGGVLAVLGLVGFHPQVSPDQLLAIAGGVAGVLGVFHTYTTVATTTRIGLPPGPATLDRPDIPPLRNDGQ